MWNKIIEQLENIMNANDLIQEVFIYEAEKFEGSPSITITPSGNESEYSTLEENERIYAFSIKVFVNRSFAPTGEKVEPWVDSNLRTITDSILDDIDKNYLLPDMDLDGILGKTFINLFAVPSIWGYAGREDTYRVVEILVTARVSIDINSIS